MSSLTIQLRPAHATDAAAIATLHAASWRHAYRGALSDEYLAGDIETDRLTLWTHRLAVPGAQQIVLVAESAVQLHGFACARLEDDIHWGTLLDNIHVLQTMHRTGIGSQLLRTVACHSVTANPDQGMYLWVLQNNLKAQEFYRYHGAKQVGTDIWAAPGGTQVPRFRFAWSAGQLPTHM